jgi:SWI/SNF-related matrix-associated actin-dependent regulator of chromatin subfamily A3
MNDPFTLKTKLKHIQEEARAWCLQREATLYENKVRGGFLSDEPGMGKTLSMISVIQQNPGPAFDWDSGDAALTLIVCPPGVISVWVSEFLKHTTLTRDRILVYHGKDRHKLSPTARTLVVITSYGILQRECIMDEPASCPEDLLGAFVEDSILPNNWYRIILDETHLAKNHKSKTSIAFTYLIGHNRWVVTATPLINNLDDDFSYFRFLGLFTKWASWRKVVPSTKSHITDDKLQHLAETKETLTRIKQSLMLRRSKELLCLPPKTEHYLALDWASAAEKNFYNSLVAYALSRLATIQHNINCKIFEAHARMLGSCALLLILRLRQATSNCHLVLDTMPRLSGVNNIEDATKVIEFYNNNINRKEECPICLDCSADHISSICGHKLCKGCWDRVLEKNSSCPYCRKALDVADINPVDGNAVPMSEEKLISKNTDYGLQEKSTKLLRLESLVESHIDQTKIVIVSQSVKMLDYVGAHFSEKWGAMSLRIDGSCSLAQRAATINSFQTNPNKRIIYLSLTCNPEGITLTEGTILIHLDQWWNKTGKTTQTNDRIHRIGQTKPTSIYYLYIDKTIESNVFKLQRRKERHINYDFESDEARVKPDLLDHKFLEAPPVDAGGVQQLIDLIQPQPEAPAGPEEPAGPAGPEAPGAPPEVEEVE